MLAGYRPRSPPLLDSSLTPDRCHSLCPLRSLYGRYGYADRFTSCHTRSRLGLDGIIDRLQPPVQDLTAEPANVRVQRRQAIWNSAPAALDRPLHLNC
ncbi:MAG: hypothetical protein HC936_01260 [Leptolyngbyaceae cyanobacterium SU_3_3]|nr:hypothetical protein [Leptolyngbyaceae cyanobacterium SU_3_3]